MYFQRRKRKRPSEMVFVTFINLQNVASSRRSISNKVAQIKILLKMNISPIARSNKLNFRQKTMRHYTIYYTIHYTLCYHTSNAQFAVATKKVERHS